MRKTAIAALLLTMPALAACTENATTDSGAADTGDARSLTVESSDDACQVSATDAPAGTLTFDVTNTGSQVTEFYLLGEDGLRIVAEVENVGPNLNRALVANVPAGTYTTACKPGMTGEGIRAAFTVTPSDEDGTVDADDQQLVDQATANYATYVQDQSDQLLVKTTQFVKDYEAGNDEAARTLYPVARTHWERIETVAESFGDLDPKMDLREADVEPGDEWTGWHRIEKDLWPERAPGYTPLTPAERTTYGDDLLANTTELDSRVQDLTYTVDQIANGSRGLLEEVATGKVTGEEEYWSRTDLYDFQANVDGARVGFEGLEPILEVKDPDLAQQLTTRFADLQTLLDATKVGDGFKLYDDLTQPEIKALSDAVNALSEPLAADRGGAVLTPPAGRFSRRGLLGGGVAAAGVAGAFVAGRASEGATTTPASGGGGLTYPFHGEHQAGIVTPAQDRLHFAAFDVITEDRDELIALLQAWTAAAARMTQGLPAGEIGPVEGASTLPPDDTGEAIGLDAAGLTITFGFGPGLFTDADGADRFGLAARQPAALRTLPHFPADMLDETKSYGDLCVQACADDPQIAVHAIRNLARLGFGTVSVRWSQLGFGRTSTTSTAQSTPRNLFGFKDGTMNVKAEETAALEEHLWVQPGADPQADWLAGGSYLVARRINMQIEVWDRQPLGDQEDFVGRTKDSGAPLSGGTEMTAPDFDLPGSDGPIIPEDAHVRMVHPDFNGGARMLRRGYNFVDGSDALGGLNAGLFFIAYVIDPDTHFIPVQTRMARSDALMEYLKVTGSALFAVPPGVAEGEYVGQSLFV